MAKFYGFDYSDLPNGETKIVRSVDYSKIILKWVRRRNHNYLRITRILKCLVTLGLDQEASEFYGCLEKVYEENSDTIGSETFAFWTETVKSII